MFLNKQYKTISVTQMHEYGETAAKCFNVIYADGSKKSFTELGVPQLSNTPVVIDISNCIAIDAENTIPPGGQTAFFTYVLSKWTTATYQRVSYTNNAGGLTELNYTIPSNAKGILVRGEKGNLYWSLDLDSNSFYGCTQVASTVITVDASTATWSSLTTTFKNDNDYFIALIKNRKISASYSGYGDGITRYVEIWCF